MGLKYDTTHDALRVFFVVIQMGKEQSPLRCSVCRNKLTLTLYNLGKNIF